MSSVRQVLLHVCCTPRVVAASLLALVVRRDLVDVAVLEQPSAPNLGRDESDFPGFNTKEMGTSGNEEALPPPERAGGAADRTGPACAFQPQVELRTERGPYGNEKAALGVRGGASVMNVY
jgi:hypothetical protein